MSKNLIERLRARTLSKWSSDVQAVEEFEDELAEEAANELERLITALTFIRDAEMDDVTFSELQRAAEEALEPTT